MHTHAKITNIGNKWLLLSINVSAGSGKDEKVTNVNVAQEDRGKLLLKWRTTLGWNVAEAAKRAGVSTRTISSIESGAQLMSEASWRLFAHEAVAEINHIPQTVVVIASDGTTPIDVVTEQGYIGHALADDGHTAIIASHTIDRVTGQPGIYRTKFDVKHNAHVLRAVDRWEEAMIIGSEAERMAFTTHRWLMRRSLEGELRNPQLRPLKDAIDAARAELDQAGTNAPEELRRDLIRKMDLAIAELMEEVAKATKQAAR